MCVCVCVCAYVCVCVCVCVYAYVRACVGFLYLLCDLRIRIYAIIFINRDIIDVYR